MRIFIVALVASLFLAAGSAAQEKKLKITPVKPMSGASGAENYKAYCASCHGLTGKGDGPAIAALKAPPKDLGLLASAHKGKYPADYVLAVLNGKASVAAHGSQEMPVWGPVFMSFEKESEMRLRLNTLVDHIGTLQKK